MHALTPRPALSHSPHSEGIGTPSRRRGSKAERKGNVGNVHGNAAEGDATAIQVEAAEGEAAAIQVEAAERDTAVIQVEAAEEDAAAIQVLLVGGVWTGYSTRLDSRTENREDSGTTHNSRL